LSDDLLLSLKGFTPQLQGLWQFTEYPIITLALQRSKEVNNDFSGKARDSPRIIIAQDCSKSRTREPRLTQVGAPNLPLFD
jgi:hypothetical protein